MSLSSASSSQRSDLFRVWDDSDTEVEGVGAEAMSLASHGNGGEHA